MSVRPRLLLTYLHPTSFVRDDIALLEEHYDVRLFPFEGHQGGRLGRALALPRLALEQRRWLLAEAPQADVILTWFADYHAALPVRLGRRVGVPVAVMLGGFDCNHLPELRYGVYESRWRARLVHYVLRNADLLLPVSASLIASQNRYATWPEPRRQGVRTYVPDLATPYTVLPTGYDPSAWPMGPAERGRTVCTVGMMTSDRSVRLKGGDLLFEAARLLPDVAFRVVGVPEGDQEGVRMRYRPPSNVELIGPQPRERLPEVYGAASVYAQLSRSEGLPSVLCEAMLCGCVPVVSAVGAMAEVVGPLGEVVESPGPAEIAAALEQVLAGADSLRAAARARIVEGYSREQRRDALLGALRLLTLRRA